MPQTVKDIIARVAWEIDDEYFDILKKPELIKALDRVYREFCLGTRLLSAQIAFTANGSTTDYELFGTNTTTGKAFGDEILQFFRVTTAGSRITEVPFEQLQQELEGNTQSISDTPAHYAVKYDGKHQHMYFSVAFSGDVVIRYYVYPRIGTLVSDTDTFSIDDKYTDTLVYGLIVWAYTRLVTKYVKKLNEEKVDKDTIALVVKFFLGERKKHEDKWSSEIEKARIQVNQWAEESTATKMYISSPFEDLDDFTDEDYTGMP